MPSISGPVIIKRDPDKDSDRTAPQVRVGASWDSRLPKEYICNLTYERIRQIRRDPTICLARQAVLAPIIHTPWMFKEKEDAPEGALDFIKKNMEYHRNWLLQGSIFGALDYGWMPYELVYQAKNGEIHFAKFKQLLQEYTTILVYVDTGDFAGFINEPYGFTNSRDEVQIFKPYCMNVNLEVDGTNWYGRSVYECVSGVQRSWEDVEVVARRYDTKVAGSMWVVYYPVGTTEFQGVKTKNSEIAKSVLDNLTASGGVTVPDEIQDYLIDLEGADTMDRDRKGRWRIELISPSGTSSQNTFVDRQKYLDNLKVRAFGIPERSLLEGKFGTKAEAETHADIAMQTIDMKHRFVVDQYNKQAVNYLLRLNYGEEAEDTVYIEVAPLVDTQYATIKELYRLIIQHPKVGPKEIANLNIRTLREELGLFEAPGADEVLEYEEPEPPPVPNLPFGQNQNQNQNNSEEEEEPNNG